MTRILHVIPGLTGGGAELQLTTLATMQARRGHGVHIAVLRMDVPAQLTESGVAVHQLHATSSFDPGMFWRLHGIVRKTRPEVVQTWLTLPDVVGGSVALANSTPWVLSERSEAAAYPPSWKHRARIQLARRCDAIIANSERGASYWTSHGVPANRITVIPNAVTVPPAQDVRPATLPDAFAYRPLVVFAGRLSAEKNPLVLIDALALALAETNAVALLCGSGPLEQEIIARIRSHAMQDRIVLAGYRDDVPSLMRRAELCVAISLFEGNPNVVLEAMAVGCPLVVSDIPAYTRLLDHSTARIVPVSNAVATARAIVEVLHNPQEAANRAALAIHGVARRTPAELADAHEHVYDQLV